MPLKSNFTIKRKRNLLIRGCSDVSMFSTTSHVSLRVCQFNLRLRSLFAAYILLDNNPCPLASMKFHVFVIKILSIYCGCDALPLL